MKFLADESVDRQIVDRLRQEGHIVQYVAELEPGISDDEVLELANHELALLLTADKDFGELVFRQRRMAAGVVLIRLAGLSSVGKANLVASAINQHAGDIAQGFTVISVGALRIRKQQL